MTAQEYRDALAKRGLNVTTAAELLGICRRTSQEFANRGTPAKPHARIAKALAKLEDTN